VTTLPDVTVVATLPPDVIAKAVVVVVEAQACWRPTHIARQAVAMKQKEERKENGNMQLRMDVC
jgi:hypothetical protein